MRFFRILLFGSIVRGPRHVVNLARQCVHDSSRHSASYATVLLLAWCGGSRPFIIDQDSFRNEPCAQDPLTFMYYISTALISSQCPACNKHSSKDGTTIRQRTLRAAGFGHRSSQRPRNVQKLQLLFAFLARPRPGVAECLSLGTKS